MRSVLRATAAAAALLAAGGAQAEIIYGLQGSNIVRFDSANLGAGVQTKAILGVAASETLLGIDYRPANDSYYALGSSGGLYLLSQGATAWQATSIGSVTAPLNGPNVEIDFNPAADRLRVVGANNQSLRVNQLAGGATTVDGSFNYAAGGAPAVIAAAYANNVPGATTTTFYAVDASNDTLARVVPPNDGTLVTVGSLGGLDLSASDAIGFDISRWSGLSYLSYDGGLYSVNLATGGTTLLGDIGVAGVTDIAVGVPEPTTWALMIGGMGLVGAVLRRRRATSLA